MREGLLPGARAEVTVVVTPDMTAQFEELGPVHPVYSTWSMIRHMELACRKIILPYLEPDEEAVGYSVSVTHLAPTPVGMRVAVRARLAQIDGNRIVCDVEAINELTRIGEGTQVQVVLPKQRLAARIAKMSGHSQHSEKGVDEA
jgi:predicted thioesterase